MMVMKTRLFDLIYLPETYQRLCQIKSAHEKYILLITVWTLSGSIVLNQVTQWLLQHDGSDLQLLIENPAARVARFIDGLNLMTVSFFGDTVMSKVNDLLPRF